MDNGYSQDGSQTRKVHFATFHTLAGQEVVNFDFVDGLGFVGQRFKAVRERRVLTRLRRPKRVASPSDSWTYVSPMTKADRNLPFARLHLLSAARVRGNCFSRSFIARPSCQTESGHQAVILSPPLIRNQQLQRRLPRLLRPELCPPRLGRSRNGSSPGRTHLPLFRWLLNRLTLRCHPLCDPGSNIGKSPGAELPLGLLRRFG
jgi:hypothetical protein